jgi:UPF0755 protein
MKRVVMRLLKGLLAGGLLAGILVCAIGGWFWRQLNVALQPPAGGAIVSIAPGEPFRQVSVRLEEAGVVRDARVIHWWARWSGEDRLVRSGDYRFEQPGSPLDVLQMLQTAGAALHRVTIPEGRTIRDVAALLESAGFGGADEFLCLVRDPQFLLSLDLPASGIEGYLFPDTYDFGWASTPEDVLRHMVDHFRKQTEALRPNLQASGLTQEEMVILASVIESETGVAAERAIISGVFHNRLRIGMRLQADPTAVYERGGGKPTARDLRIDSPYNTYIHPGLPPGPICNPGLAAMAAAVEPAAVPYLYFVARQDGTHVFSRTLEEHNRAVAALRRTVAR